MNKERWVEILVVGVILATLAWLAVTVFSLNSTVSRVDGTIQKTEQRLDRIAEVLPDMRIKIAFEELRKRLDLGVFCKRPSQDKKGNWNLALSIVDARRATETRYMLAVGGPSDDRVDLFRHAMRGVLASDDRRTLLSEVVMWSNAASQDLPQLKFIDPECSSLYHGKTSDDYQQALAAYKRAIELLELRENEVRRLDQTSVTVGEISALLGRIDKDRE